MKYQEALDRLKTINLDIVLNELDYEKACEVSIYGIHDYPTLEMSGDITVLQELVDKANKYDEKETPKKALKNTKYDNCPACYMPLVDYDKDDVTAAYCRYCGQRL